LITQKPDEEQIIETRQTHAARMQQDLLEEQTPLMLGLISHLTDTVQQEDIVAMAGRFISKGKAVMGLFSPRPPYDQTNPPPGAAAAHSVAV
jgi:hypothetical protein